MVWCCTARRTQGERACRRCGRATTCPLPRRNAEVLRHLPLAFHTAERYARRAGCRGGADRDDLRSESALALIPAVENFEPDRGHRFSSYAVPKVLGKLRHHLRDDWQELHMPRRLLELQQRVLRLQRLRLQKGLGPASPEELCRALPCTEAQLEQAALAWGLQQVVSLDGLPSEAITEQAHGADNDPQLDWIREALQLLSPADRHLVNAIWIDGLPRRSLAAQLGLSLRELSQRLDALLDQLTQSAIANRAAIVV